MARQATSSKARLAQRSKATPSKINKGPGKIIKSTVRKAGTAKRSLAARSAEAAQLEASVSPVEVSVPLLNLPPVTLPPVELPALSLPRTDLPPVILPPVETPTVTLPPTDPLTGTPPGSRPSVAAPLPQADARAAQVEGTASAQTQEETAGTPQGSLAEAGITVLTAFTASTPSMLAWAMMSIGPPAAAFADELGQRITEVSASIDPIATALVLAAAIGAAATGTAGSGSAGATGLAILSTALRLPALGGSRRLRGRLRESAFRRPRLPGFSPD